MLIKDDYKNLRAFLERVEVKGVGEAQVLAIIALKLEQRIAEWFDGHVTGFKVQDYAITQVAPPIPPSGAATPAVPALLDNKVSSIFQPSEAFPLT